MAYAERYCFLKSQEIKIVPIALGATENETLKPQPSVDI